MHSNLAFASPVGAVSEVLEIQWGEVKERLAIQLGISVFKAWFGEVTFTGVEGTTVHLSVPSQSIKEGIKKEHFAVLLLFWQAERPNVERIKISARSVSPPKPAALPSPPPAPKVPAINSPPPREVRREPGSILVEEIQRIVAEHYHVPRADLLSHWRTREIVKPRRIAMYFAKTFKPSRSFPWIGRQFGGKDHTSVHYAIRKVEEEIATDPAFAKEIELLREEILFS